MSESKDFIIVDGILTRYDGPGGDVIIPEGVTSIGNNAFRGCKTMISLTLPESTTKIGYYAVAACSGLKSVRQNKGLTHIGDGAFSSCESLELIELPEGLTTIGEYAFSGCSQLKELHFPNSLRAFSTGAFQRCNSLRSVVIPDGTTTVGWHAFRDCKGLQSVYIPKSVSFFGEYFLFGCFCDIFLKSWTPEFTKGLSNAGGIIKDLHVEDISSVPSKYKHLAAIGFIHENNTVLATDRAKAHMKYLTNNATKVSSIAMEDPTVLAFLCENGLIKAKDIDTFLEEATQSNSVESKAMLLDYQNKIGENAVEKARQKKRASVEKTELDVARRAQERTVFKGINGLTFVLSGKISTWPYPVAWSSRDDVVKYLEEYGARVARTVSPNTDYVVSFDSDEHSAEEKAKRLGIRILTEKEFNLMVGKRFEEKEHVSVPSWMKYVPADAFRGDMIRKNTTLKTVSLPSSITRIDHGAFFSCEGLTEITVPEKVTMIDSFAFCGCKSLKKVVLNAGLKEIGKEAFSECTTLSEITVPKGVKIHGKAFSGCKLLSDHDGFIVFNDELIESIYLKKQVTIPEGIKHIGEQAFELLSFSRGLDNPLAEVCFPSGLISIGDRAFAVCKLLTSLALPEGLQHIGHAAFIGCRDLKRVWIPNSTVQIEDDAFANCSKVKIFAPAGSFAEQFAEKQGIRFSPCERNGFEELVEKSRKKK